MKTKHLFTVVGLLILGGAASAYFLLRSPDATQPTAIAEHNDDVAEAKGTSSSTVVVGGVERPATDVRLEADRRGEAKSPPRRRQGFSPAVKAEDSEEASYVLAKLQSRDEPSAFSSFAPAKPFDAAAYTADPASYLSATEPSRVFAPAQPSAETPVIQPDGARFHRLRQGESVRLSVVAAPEAPVTFASQDLGQFENKLTSITVQANAEGVAEATYTASGGTIDLVQVLAASPLTSGQVAFALHVSVTDNKP